MVTVSQGWRLLYAGPALTAIQIIFLIDAIGRGIDYSYPPGTTALTLETVEQAAPIQWWGFGLIIGALAVITAQVAHRPAIAVFGELALGVLLFTLGASLFLAVADRPYWEGFRTGLTLMCVGATHLALAYGVVRTNSLWRWSNVPDPR
ncbi:hypothetical protein R3Q06_17910 [Rhodococcus erythropolis]|uniref:hypothetical protein n=1 Tax=Rhodococcus erythropolis TaxID=1833 RepID=UPI00294A49FE|nr:hypothetical protein [Rhodococcus erythropolis]MDV6275373.1 hypothetical protein [Rhodococcus erythropolis]